MAQNQASVIPVPFRERFQNRYEVLEKKTRVLKVWCQPPEQIHLQRIGCKPILFTLSLRGWERSTLYRNCLRKRFLSAVLTTAHVAVLPAVRPRNCGNTHPSKAYEAIYLLFGFCLIIPRLFDII